MSKEPKARSVTDTIRTIDFSGLTNLRQNVRPNSALNRMVDTMQEVIVLGHMADMQDRLELNQQERQLERLKIKRQLQTGGVSGVASGGVDPVSKFMDGLSNPEMFAMWKGLSPEEQQRLLIQLQQMAMISNPAGARASVKENLGDIREIIEMFGGGGGGTSYDLEMARLNAETNWRAMQMNMQAQQMRLEQQGEIAKYEQLGAIAATAAAAAGPGIAQVVSNFAAGQAKTQGKAQTPMKPADNIPGGRILETQCPNCGVDFKVPLAPGQAVPKQITCPGCQAVLEPNVG